MLEIILIPVITVILMQIVHYSRQYFMNRSMNKKMQSLASFLEDELGADVEINVLDVEDILESEPKKDDKNDLH